MTVVGYPSSDFRRRRPSPSTFRTRVGRRGARDAVGCAWAAQRGWHRPNVLVSHHGWGLARRSAMRSTWCSNGSPALNPRRRISPVR
jgi:hypothetical protein